MQSHRNNKNKENLTKSHLQENKKDNISSKNATQKNKKPTRTKSK